jgi:hypothetical protein
LFTNFIISELNIEELAAVRKFYRGLTRKFILLPLGRRASLFFSKVVGFDETSGEMHRAYSAI